MEIDIQRDAAIYIYICVERGRWMQIYIYIERERDGGREFELVGRQ
jgi:hypothetical protein